MKQLDCYTANLFNYTSNTLQIIIFICFNKLVINQMYLEYKVTIMHLYSIYNVVKQHPQDILNFVQ